MQRASDPTVCSRCREEIGPAELRYACATYHRPLCLRCIEEIRARRGCGMTGGSAAAAERVPVAAAGHWCGPAPAGLGYGATCFRDREVAPGCPSRCLMPDGNGTICLETGELLPAGPCRGGLRTTAGRPERWRRPDADEIVERAPGSTRRPSHHPELTRRRSASLGPPAAAERRAPRATGKTLGLPGPPRPRRRNRREERPGFGPGRRRGYAAGSGRPSGVLGSGGRTT